MVANPFMLIVVSIVLGITGCATSTIGTGAAEETRTKFPHRSTAHSEPIVVKRNKSFAGSICNDRIFADGKPIADLAIGEKIEFTLPAGHHILGSEKQGICPGQMREITVELHGGKVRTILVDVGFNGEYIFQETAF